MWSVSQLISVLRRLSPVVSMMVAFLVAGCAGKIAPYCAWDRQYTNCGYHTLESCRAAVRGVGGYCGANPAYSGTSGAR
jgi:hypothetical protein